MHIAKFICVIYIIFLFFCRNQFVVMSNFTYSFSSENNLSRSLGNSNTSTSVSSRHSLSSATNRRIGRSSVLTAFRRNRSRSCPAVMDRLQYSEPDYIRLPPHYENFINAALAGDLPSPRLQFPDNGVMLLGHFSFSSTPESEEEPSFSLSEPFLRNHGR